LAVVEAWVAAASFAVEEALSRQYLLVLFAEKQFLEAALAVETESVYAYQFVFVFQIQLKTEELGR
tara:strand:+ start:344 stop:541 length:198 start_codon:yes stop_codon:yes gene_type:complete